jgi:hypothetical protein
MMAMNGIYYDGKNKKITIIDGHSTVVWENVEIDVKEKAEEMFAKSESIDGYLLSKGCRRYLGNN